MNETNNDQNQRPKTSIFAIASFIFLLVFLGIFLSEFLILDRYSSDPFLDGFQCTIIFIMFLTMFAAPTLGLTALIHIIFNRKDLRGKGLSITAILITSFFMLAYFFLPKLGTVKPLAGRLVCGTNMKGLVHAIQVYAGDNDGYIPTSGQWCDLLITKTDVNEKSFICSWSYLTGEIIEGESSYAFNKNVAGMKLSEISPNIVLIFETNFGIFGNVRRHPIDKRAFYNFFKDCNYEVCPGVDYVYELRWNQVGGPEILTVDNHHGEGCNIVLADGSVKFIKTKDLDTLRWEP